MVYVLILFIALVFVVFLETRHYECYLKYRKYQGKLDFFNYTKRHKPWMMLNGFIIVMLIIAIFFTFIFTR